MNREDLLWTVFGRAAEHADEDGLISEDDIVEELEGYLTLTDTEVSEDEFDSLVADLIWTLEREGYAVI